MNTRSSPDPRPLRVLVLAPTGRDSDVLVQTLSSAAMTAEACCSTADLCDRMADGAGAAVIASEVLATRHLTMLEQALERQPEWSDFPIVIMETSQGGHSPSAVPLSHAVVLVRPTHAQTLVSAVRAALRSRSRQYQVRDELADRMRAESALRESSERKDEFLAMLGHELRNPLGAIRNATQLMKLAAPEDERLRRVCGVLDRQSVHMTRLIDGLLEVSRISRGKIYLDRETLDLRDVLEATLQDRASQMEASGLQLERDLSVGPVWAWADRSRLVQIFDNLVGNAIKFTAAPGTIRVTLHQNGARAVIHVLDTGVGIRSEMLDRLFDPFQQDVQDIARAAGGLGLGLALARGLVELHGGRIRAASAGPGSGADFEVELPLAAAPVVEHPADRAARPPPRRVLIVEDNPDAGRSLCAVLEALGHVATVVETGSEALDVLHVQGADVVLCDLGLPGMSGYDIARTVRGDPSLRDVSLVAVTGYGQPEDRKRSAAAGFDDHLTKPVEVETLNRVLNESAAP